MPTVGTTSKPAYVYDAGSDTWIPIGPGEHSHSYIPNTLVDAKGDILTATAADTVSRLAVGSNDQVLTADSSTATGLKWATPAAGGMTLISTTTLTGSSVTLSSIPQDYKDLRLIVRKFQPSVNSENLSMRWNGVTSTSYRYFDWSTTSTNLRNQSFNQGLFETIAFIDQKSTNEDTNLFDMTIPDYTNTTTWKMWWGYSVAIRFDNSANLSATTRIGFHNQTAAITSISLFPNSGNFTSGTALLYGVK